MGKSRDDGAPTEKERHALVDFVMKTYKNPTYYVVVTVSECGDHATYETMSNIASSDLLCRILNDIILREHHHIVNGSSETHGHA